MKYNRLILCLLIIASLSILPLLAFFVFPKTPTQASFDRVELGMTWNNVKDIFGREPDLIMFSINEKGIRDIDCLVWHDSDGSVAYVYFKGSPEQTVSEIEWKNSAETRVVAEQIAVSNQRADHLAMRTRRLLEALGNRVPFLGAAVKPTLLTHVRPRPPTKIADLTSAEKCGVEAGYDKNILERGAGYPS